MKNTVIICLGYNPLMGKLLCQTYTKCKEKGSIPIDKYKQKSLNLKTNGDQPNGAPTQNLMCLTKFFSEYFITIF